MATISLRQYLITKLEETLHVRGVMYVYTTLNQVTGLPVELILKP